MTAVKWLEVHIATNHTGLEPVETMLSALGIDVHWHTVVGDNPQRLQEALDIARRRADILITTGGLGPTYDDLTKQTICAAFGKPLVLHPERYRCRCGGVLRRSN